MKIQTTPTDALRSGNVQRVHFSLTSAVCVILGFAAVTAIAPHAAALESPLEFAGDVSVVRATTTGARACTGSQGSSWAIACDLHGALRRAKADADSASFASAQVWVKQGTYVPQLDNRGNSQFVAQEDKTFALVGPNVRIIGGFAGTEVSASQRDHIANETILDGQSNVLSVVFAGQDDNGTYGDVDATTLLDGFTIKRGRAYGEAFTNFTRGGGLHLNSTKCTVLNCKFIDNEAIGGGAAIGGPGSSNMDIVNSTFINNVTFEGGPGAVEASNGWRFTNCLFVNNSSGQSGGSGGSGGAIGQGSSMVISNCTFYGNENMGGAGGAVTAGFGTTVVNSIFWGNIEPFGHCEKDNFACSSSNNCNQACIPNNSADIRGTVTVTYSLMQRVHAGTGNLVADPFFQSTGGGDFRLSSSSPAIDAGNNAGVPVDVFDVDLDGNTGEKTPDLDHAVRLQPFHGPPTTVDMGAYEAVTDCDGNGVADTDDITNGTHNDCQSNGIPDICDINDGTSSDCQSNAIPDECEADCDGDGIPDDCVIRDCDITNVSCQDCNSNQVPDQCDIDSTSSDDCNANGIPDECDDDCNGNGVPDDCDVDPTDPDGDSFVFDDCNNNSIPDIFGAGISCEDDCNNNLVPDACDVNPADPDGDGEVFEDCNNNLIPDICEVTPGSDFDDDGILNSCDSCPWHYNPNQEDINNNARGDACELRIANEILPPPSHPAFGTADFARTAADKIDWVCSGGLRDGNPCFTDADCGAGVCDLSRFCLQAPNDACKIDSDCPGASNSCQPSNSIDPPHSTFFYHTVYGSEGRIFVAEAASPGEVIDLFVQWLNSAGLPIGDPITYHITDEAPASEDGNGPLPYSVTPVGLIRNLLLSVPPDIFQTAWQLDSLWEPSAIYNSTIRFQADPVNGNTQPHINIALATENRHTVQLLAENATDAETPDGWFVIQWTDGFNGTLLGLEAVEIQTVTPPVEQAVDVGKKLPIPNGATGALFRRNAMLNSALAAYQRTEEPADIWPIQPSIASQLQVVWMQGNPLGNEWPLTWERYQSDWPCDPQIHVLVANEINTSVVVLPIGPGEPSDGDLYCNATDQNTLDIIMYSEALNPRVSQRDVNGETINEFVADGRGYSVLRFDTKKSGPAFNCTDHRVSVDFEVVLSQDHKDTVCTLEARCAGGCTIYQGELPAVIGLQLDDVSHNSFTPNFPFGYPYTRRPSDSLPAGRPFAKNIFDQTAQIIPVNASFTCNGGLTQGNSCLSVSDCQPGETCELAHGPLEVWWFEEGQGAPGIYWPHRSAEYSAVWPDNTEPIVIASRLGVGPYPLGTTVYAAGVFPGDDSQTLDGWNPDDEHAILLGTGANLQLYAARDDNPWNVPSGHPYVLAQYQDTQAFRHCGAGDNIGRPCLLDTDCPNGACIDFDLGAGAELNLWKMGVHRVVGEQHPYYFDYTAYSIAATSECGCSDPEVDPNSICDFDAPDCGCDFADPSVTCEVWNPDCDCGDADCPCDRTRCRGGLSSGSDCDTINDCDTRYRVCDNGVKEGQACTTDANCPWDGSCSANTCIDGPNDGQSCFNDLDCRGFASCTDERSQSVCIAGDRKDGACSVSIPPNPNPNNVDGCPWGGTCNASICSGGPRDGGACALDGDCEGFAACEAPQAPGFCRGGNHDGSQTCTEDADCAAECTLGTGVCVGRVTDCNGNGVDDSLDIGSGDLEDANQNLIPDCCETSDPGMSCSVSSAARQGSVQSCSQNSDCTRRVCVNAINEGAICTDDLSCNCDGGVIPVVAGQPLTPLFPINFGKDECLGDRSDTSACDAGTRQGELCTFDSDCPLNDLSTCDAATCTLLICDGGPRAGSPCSKDSHCGACMGGLRNGTTCGTDEDCSAFAACVASPGGIVSGPLTTITDVCVGGIRDGRLCDPQGCPGGNCTADGIWVDRTGTNWAVEQNTDEPLRETSAAAIMLWERWGADDSDGANGGCDPWRDFGTGAPTPIVYRPQWPDTPPACAWPDNPLCARPLNLGQTVVDQTNQCGPFKVLHDSVGLKLIDTTHWVHYDFVDNTYPTDIVLRELPPHLFDGSIGGVLPWDNRVAEAVFGTTTRLSFRGIMSERDRQTLADMSQNLDWQTGVFELYNLSRVQLTTPLSNPEKKFVSVADSEATPGWITIAFQNDDACVPVGSPTVQVWRVDCPPATGFVRALTPKCVFNEQQVLQHSVDGGGTPENLFYQWQWREGSGKPWHDYDPPTSPIDFSDGRGLREIIIKGSSPFTLGDSEWRVRFRGYGSCDCTEGVDCNENGEAWPGTLGGQDTAISDWTDPPMLAEGWIKRVLRGLNPFDQRIKDFHRVANTTYVSMVQQAGKRFEAQVALNCAPENINNIGLIEAYETVLNRARSFSIEQGISYAPADMALLLMSSQIAKLYALLGNEAYADALDPTIGFFGGGPSAASTSLFCFDGKLEAPDLLGEELVLMRGRADSGGVIRDQDGFILATPYNRFTPNYPPGNTNGRVAYANNYGFANEVDALLAYPQGQGDAWGHYLTATKRFYRLLKHPVFEWIVKTESVLAAGQLTEEVSYQYEREFAKIAAAKARTGASITSLTFRQRYSAEPAKQDGYHDPIDHRGVVDWARRAGQGALFDWMMVNALLDDDDDDPQHQNTVRKVDRTTVTETREIAAAYGEIQSTLDNADRGLNPLGLSPNVVPFGLDPSDDRTHFEQVAARAQGAIGHLEAVFDFANDNTRRLREVQDDSTDFASTVAEREMDFRNRLIEIFGRPYTEDVGPGATYSSGECPDGQCPDILHFDYVDAANITGLSATPKTTTFAGKFKFTNINPDTGVVSEAVRTVEFNIATNGYGMVAPPSWNPRPEPGEIQLARSEMLQSLAAMQLSLANFDVLLLDISDKARDIDNLYNLNSSTLKIQRQGQAEEATLRSLMATSQIARLALNHIASGIKSVAEAASAGVPGVVGAGFTVIVDAGAIGRAIAKSAGAAAAGTVETLAEIAEGAEIAMDTTLALMQTANSIRITDLQQSFDLSNERFDLERLLRLIEPAKLEVYVQGEAARQAIGRYHSAVGRGVRLLEERTAFRQTTAKNVSEYRYQDMAFRVFRNEALQKLSAQFDLTARYVYLAALAYDYETNLRTADDRNGRDFLERIIRERLIGETADGGSITSAGLAGALGDLQNDFEAVRGALQIDNANLIPATFGLRWEHARLGRGTDPDGTDWDELWRSFLRAGKIDDLRNYQPYLRHAALIPDKGGKIPAIVIEFDTGNRTFENFFGESSVDVGGDEVIPSAIKSIKIGKIAVRFEDVPAGLDNQIPVYLIPVGADVSRSSHCGVNDTIVRTLVDQSLPSVSVLQGLESSDWQPWDSIEGGASSLVRSRPVAPIRAFDISEDNPLDSICSDGLVDTTITLAGRSAWNTEWLLIIPFDSETELNTFVGEENTAGIADIKLRICIHGSAGCIP